MSLEHAFLPNYSYSTVRTRHIIFLLYMKAVPDVARFSQLHYSLDPNPLITVRGAAHKNNPLTSLSQNCKCHIWLISLDCPLWLRTCQSWICHLWTTRPYEHIVLAGCFFQQASRLITVCITRCCD